MDEPQDEEAREVWAGRVLKACTAAGHGLRSWDDFSHFATIYQHGDNPEAQLIIPDTDAFHSPDRSRAPAIARWVNRIHEYEKPRD